MYSVHIYTQEVNFKQVNNNKMTFHNRLSVQLLQSMN